MKKIVLKGASLILTGTMLASLLSGCTGKFVTPDSGILKNNYGKMSNGYILDDSSFDELFVVQDENDYLRLYEDGKLLYSNKKAEKDSITKPAPIYKYVDKDVLLSAYNEYTESDYINLEHYINGDVDQSVLPSEKLDKYDLVRTDSYFQCELNGLYYKGDFSYLKVLLVDDKVYSIIRTTKNDDSGIDILSGNHVYVNNEEKEVSKSIKDTVIAKDNFSETLKLIPLADLFTSLDKSTFTNIEITDIYYLIEGKTKEEAKDALKDYNKSANGNQKVLANK